MAFGVVLRRVAAVKIEGDHLIPISRSRSETTKGRPTRSTHHFAQRITLWGRGDSNPSNPTLPARGTEVGEVGAGL
jgi:hypothetical protein